MKVADYANNLGLLVNTLDQAEFLLHCQSRYQDELAFT